MLLLSRIKSPLLQHISVLQHESINKIAKRYLRHLVAMRILRVALLLPAVVATTLKTCGIDGPCDVCADEEALFPIEAATFAYTGICVGKTR